MRFGLVSGSLTLRRGDMAARAAPPAIHQIKTTDRIVPFAVRNR
jgi:hypothetical protein